MKKLFLSFVVLLLLLAGCTHGPKAPPFTVDSERAQLIDERVQQVGYPKNSSIKSLTAALVKGLDNDHERLYAVYRWVSRYINYDVEAYLSGRFISDSSPSETFKTGVGVCDGFSELLAEMGAQAGLQLVTVEGFAKGFAAAVVPGSGQKSNHMWNAVKLDGRWQLLDATWDAGKVDEATRRFVRKAGVPSYFLVDPASFATTHFPADTRWQLLERPVDFKTFMGSTQLMPQLAQFKLDASLHTQEKVQIPDTPYRFHFGNEVQHIRMGLKQNDRAVEGNWSMLVWDAHGRPDLWVSAPKPGTYEAHLFAAPNTQTEELTQVLHYKLDVRRAATLNGGFPFAYAAYYAHKTQWVEPMSGVLAAGKPVRFQFKAGRARYAAVFLNGAYLQDLKFAQGRFEGQVTPPPGALSVGVMRPGDADFQMVLGFQVRP